MAPDVYEGPKIAAHSQFKPSHTTRNSYCVYKKSAPGHQKIYAVALAERT